MNIALWVIQALLAAMFGMAGVMKLTRSKEALAKMLPWVADSSLSMVRFIGVVELLAALGLILPVATGILPVLTPLAAVGLAVIMVLAAIVHARRRENSGIAFNVVLLVLSLVVAWGRFGPYAN